MIHITVAMVILSIAVAIATADDRFEMDMAKGLRSQVIDDRVKAPLAYNTSN